MGGRRSDSNIGTRQLGNKVSTRPIEQDNWPIGDVLLQIAGGIVTDNKGI